MAKDLRASRRKKHRNSKLGCATCKRRRVKCSETLPECANCVKHGTRCEYLDYSEEQLDEFKKAKREHYDREPSQRAVGDASTHTMENLSLASPSASAKEPTQTQEKRLHLGRSASENTFNRPPLSGMLSSQSLSYPGIRMSGAHYGDTYRGQISPVEGTFTSPTIAEHVTMEPANQFQDSASPDRPDLRSRISSADSVPVLQSSGITQNFDNLLTEQDHQIIYPVYSFRKSVESQWGYDSAVLPESKHEDGSDLSRSPSSGSSGENHPDSHSDHSSATSLPHAVVRHTTFSVLRAEDMDFDARLYSYIINLGPLIAQGKAELPQIRELYHVWLGHFICKAFESSIMFSCLTNLTTNYLITNVFRGRRAHPLGSAAQVKSLRKTLFMHSISHYAAVIKSLRSLLNRNSDPQLASSVSYILSIMSIYDPEATVNSTVCFRDGMFSVLSYTLSLAKNKGIPSPLFVPIHMQLAANIVRTVYLPAYDPSFLGEYEIMLHRLGTTISSISPFEIRNRATFEFIVEVYEDLWKFCQESIQVHIPAVNKNLDDVPLQLDILFRMFRRWANLGPSRLMTVSRSTDPLEKVLNLFFRLFRKAVYAVVPQVKFCFLRDFDSPLMLDVFPTSCDASVLYSLDTPEKQCLAPEAYARILSELKLLSAYAIRLVTFLNMRIAILYKNLVYNDKVRRLYPIDNIVDWKDSISDIHATRKEFSDRIGLSEVCIKSFKSTYISQSHYPRILEFGSPEHPMDLAEDGNEITVDLLSLKPHGLLEQDELPQTT